MDSYTSFAYVYDKFMNNVPYEEWTEYIISLLHKENIDEGIVVDLGCGTGNVTEILASAGFDMIGIDGSEDMLSVAMEKKQSLTNLEHDILYLCQDMREFELYGTVAAIVSVCDCVNYITDPEDLQHVFDLVWNYLDYNGIFVFDLNSQYKYEALLAENTFAENTDDASFIWENYYDEDSRINEYDLTLYIKEGEQYSRYEEVHEQRAYSINEIVEMLEKANLELLHVYDAFTENEPTKESERIYFVARKNDESK